MRLFYSDTLQAPPTNKLATLFTQMLQGFDWRNEFLFEIDKDSCAPTGACYWLRLSDYWSIMITTRMGNNTLVLSRLQQREETTSLLRNLIYSLWKLLHSSNGQEGDLRSFLVICKPLLLSNLVWWPTSDLSDYSSRHEISYLDSLHSVDGYDIAITNCAIKHWQYVLVETQEHSGLHIYLEKKVIWTTN